MGAQLRVNGLCLDVHIGHVLERTKRILHDVSFNVAAGKVTAYLGPNGAGKTSTFRVLCGLCRATAGSVYLGDEKVINGLPPQRFGFMPEQPYFYRHLTTRELLHAMGRLSGLTSHAVNKRMHELAEQLNFSKVFDQPLKSCSKGQVQRIGMAQALLHEPELVLLDEPMSGLDPLGRECVRRVIAEQHARGATVLFSSHILSDVEQLCTDAVVLHQGRVVYTGDIAGLVDRQGGWSIRIQGELPAAITGLTNTQMEPDGSWLIRCSTAKDLNEILSVVVTEPNATLLSVQPVRCSLEEAFVKLLAGSQGLI